MLFYLVFCLIMIATVAFYALGLFGLIFSNASLLLVVTVISIFMAIYTTIKWLRK